MKEIISTKSRFGLIHNEITELMGLYLRNDLIEFKDTCDGTYLMFFKETEAGKDYAIRFLGATRGGLKVNKDDIITEIIVSKPGSFTACYKTSVMDVLNEFIGAKLVIKES